FSFCRLQDADRNPFRYPEIPGSPLFRVPEAQRPHPPDTGYTKRRRSAIQTYLREHNTGEGYPRPRREMCQNEPCGSSSGQIREHGAIAPAHWIFHIEMKTDSYDKNSNLFIAGPYASTFSSSAIYFYIFNSSPFNSSHIQIFNQVLYRKSNGAKLYRL